MVWTEAPPASTTISWCFRIRVEILLSGPLRLTTLLQQPTDDISHWYQLESNICYALFRSCTVHVFMLTAHSDTWISELMCNCAYVQIHNEHSLCNPGNSGTRHLTGPHVFSVGMGDNKYLQFSLLLRRPYCRKYLYFILLNSPSWAAAFWCDDDQLGILLSQVL